MTNLLSIEPVNALMVVSKAFTPEHCANQPVAVINTSLRNLFYWYDQGRVIAFMRLIQILNLAELDHGIRLTYTRTARSIKSVVSLRFS